jgi:hypothetical protein
MEVNFVKKLIMVLALASLLAVPTVASAAPTQVSWSASGDATSEFSYSFKEGALTTIPANGTLKQYVGPDVVDVEVTGIQILVGGYYFGNPVMTFLNGNDPVASINFEENDQVDYNVWSRTDTEDVSGLNQFHLAGFWYYVPGWDIEHAYYDIEGYGSEVPELPVGMLIPLLAFIGTGMVWLRKRK